MAQLVAAQYARGLFELALETNQFDAVSDNLLSIKKVIAHSDFCLALAHPQIEADEKFAILKHYLADNAPNEVLGFLRLLVERGRADILSTVIDEYMKLVDERNNVIFAEVVSAEKLSEEQLERIKSMLMSKFKKEIRLEEEIDTSVIAGFKVYIGDNLIDTSIKKDINDMRSSLLETGRMQ
ncbi:MAG: ATP synthase F1 subunit delta [Defluviitaleaceae bacterium]|nr:ATP synthase F1 subunit delta [Defluviitaleaceae bacterium]